MRTEAPPGFRFHEEPAISRHDRSSSRLAQRLRAGDQRAVGAVIDEYRPLMLAFVTSMLKDPTEAEDVLQQCLIDVWRGGHRYDPERGSLRTWLLVICRSRALDQLRRRVPEPRDPASLSTELADPHAPLEDVLDQWRLADLMRRLPASEAQLLRLRFHDGLSQQEIAQRTGIALGTVKATMVRGLRRLRDLLEEDPA